MSQSALGPETTNIFPFEQLPSELRNRVYGCLVTTPLTTVEIDEGLRSPRSREGYHDLVHAVSHLQSLKLNRAIYSEASSFFYGSKEFIFHSRNNVQLIDSFFQKMTPSSRLSIRKLELHLDLDNMQSSTWVNTCSYLAHQMALQELKLRISVCGSHCRFECPSEASNLNATWATALALIKGLNNFSIHTCTCEGRCGFSEDGIFAEENVQEEEDGDAEQEKEMLCRMFHSLWEGPCDCHCYVECGFECFKRDFVEGLRERMGLRTGERFTHVLTGEYVGCYKDVDPKDVVVPAAGSVLGLSSYCLKMKTHAEDDGEEWEDDSEEAEGSEEKEEVNDKEDTEG